MPLFSRLFAQFQSRYPMGSLIAEFVTIHDGQLIVRALAQQGGFTLSTGMAAGATIEAAEDQAKLRALEALGFTALGVHNSYANLPGSPSLSDGAIAPESLSGSTDNFADLPTPPSSTFTSVDRSWDSPLSMATSLRPVSPQPTTPPLQTPLTPIPSPEPEPERIVADLYSHIRLETSDGDEISDTIPDLPRASSLLNKSSTPKPDPQPEETSEPDLPKSKTSRKSTTLSEPESEPEPPSTIDFSDILAQTDVEMRRLGWDARRGREYLKKTYSKRSRQELDEAELYDFLNYLKEQPSPNGSA